MEAWRAYLIKISTGKNVRKSRQVCICLTENEDEMNYKIYTVLLSQVGVGVPTAIVLEDTIGGTPVYFYDGGGGYHLINIGKFTNNKTFIYIRPVKSAAGLFGNPKSQFDYDLVNLDQINIYSADGTNTLTDGLLLNTEFEIRVYP